MFLSLVPPGFLWGSSRETFFTTSCIYVNVRPAGITQKTDDKIGSGGGKAEKALYSPTGAFDNIHIFAYTISSRANCDTDIPPPG